MPKRAPTMPKRAPTMPKRALRGLNKSWPGCVSAGTESSRRQEKIMLRDHSRHGFLRRRQAFTLVEMLVSLALVLFIMVLLSQALSTGLETFRQLKSTAELDEKLRMASTVLREDLKLDHFE